MSAIDYNLDRDLREAEAMVEQLKPYVYEEPLYGRTRGGMFGSGNMPALTIGALVMRLRRLRLLEGELTAAQRGKLSDIEKEHEAVRKEWYQHYVAKLNREGESRLKAMNMFFDECREDPRNCPNIYLPEVLRRTIVQEIIIALDSLQEPSDALQKEARRVDSKLRTVTRPADFIWSTTLQPVYPQNTFWWMYAKPPKVN